MEKIGFVGLGAMGGHMARHLLKAGHDVYVSDLNSDTVAAAVMHGAFRCESPLHVADNAEIVLTCLPTPEIVEEVALSEYGIGSGSAVKYFVDHSTVGHTVSSRIAAKLAERNILALDAPLAGGVAGAEAGTLSVMVGGNADAYRRCEPIFQAFGRNVVHVGDQPGLGQTLKLVNNMIVGATLVATCEAVLFGIKNGLDPQVLIDMLNKSTARSFTSETIVAGSILERRFDLGFRMDLMRKDLRLFLLEAERVGAATFATSVVKQFFDRAVASGNGGEDMSKVVLELEALTGVEIARRA
ncbi:NAD(P)-dependent oxidoreductase [Variovorax sp. LjRoot290]|uniref:NAD(P)-dependent oxidoreductase n=1 Tax=Variovorax sp. LjRoot290 TaxID=3342316 RepID=UPI003ECC8508